MVGRFFQFARFAVDAAIDKAFRQRGRNQKMVDADALILAEHIAPVFPKRELSGFVAMKMAERVNVSHIQPFLEACLHLRLEQRIRFPVLDVVAVDVARDDVVIAADDNLGFCCLQRAQAFFETVHPFQLVSEIVRSGRVAVGQVNVDDANAADIGFKVAGM